MMFDICFSQAHNDAYAGNWDYVLSHWKPETVYVLGSDTNPWASHNPLKNAVPVVNAEELPDKLIVLVAPLGGQFCAGDVSLFDFVHPDNCIYLFGPDNAHMCMDQLGSRVPDHSVYIPTDTTDEMYSYIAAAVTMYDRAVKNG